MLAVEGQQVLPVVRIDTVLIRLKKLAVTDICRAGLVDFFPVKVIQTKGRLLYKTRNIGIIRTPANLVDGNLLR